MAERLGLLEVGRPGKRAPRPTRAPDPLKGGDVYKWAMEQAALLRAGRLDQIDVANVADEIESVGKSEFRSLTSNLEVILTHLLKWDHQASRRTRSWVLSIAEHRQRARDDLSDSPSLQLKLDEAMTRAYRLARSSAARQTHLPLRDFPPECPYDWQSVMERTIDLERPGSPS